MSLQIQMLCRSFGRHAAQLFHFFYLIEISINVPQVLAFTCLSTLLGFLEPAFNAFFLMTLGVPSCAMLIYNLRRERANFRVASLGRRSIALW